MTKMTKTALLAAAAFCVSGTLAHAEERAVDIKGSIEQTTVVKGGNITMSYQGEDVANSLNAFRSGEVGGSLVQETTLEGVNIAMSYQGGDVKNEVGFVERAKVAAT
ncbi:MAG: hypothetical protein R3C42_01140 [Parvularculaceae bacterium]